MTMLELRFDLDVQAADAERRTIEGTIVPWNEPASIAGVRYSFRPGSLQAGARTPLLLDHDRTQPIGVLAELDNAGHGAVARFRVDKTAAGDEALVQASSGSRGAFSVLASIVDHVERDGVVDVLASQLREVSLLPLGAFAGATVDRVTATATEPEPEPDDEPEPEPEPEEETVSEPIEAAAPPVIRAELAPSALELSAGEYALLAVRAQQGDAEALRSIRAALTETTSADLTGVLPPQYEGTVLGGKETPRILWSIFKGKALPGIGLAVQKPTWTTFPNGAWAANVDADATTGKAVIGLNPAAVERWDWATAISYVAAQRSSPDAIDAIYAQAVQGFYEDVETRIAALLANAAVNAATSLGAGIAAFYNASLRVPDVIVVAPDVWGVLADAKAIDRAIGFGDTLRSAGGLAGEFAGVTIVASPGVAPGSATLATRRALDVRTSDPVRLTANAIGALNVELGVVGEGLFDTDYPAELMLLTAPLNLPLASSASSRK
jgi:hypothetical protein